MSEFLINRGSVTGFLGLYRLSLDRLEQVADASGRFDERPRTPERLVAAAWFEQKLDHDNLRCADGRKLKVLSPGR
jgi:hypothetical protein